MYQDSYAESSLLVRTRTCTMFVLFAGERLYLLLLCQQTLTNLTPIHVRIIPGIEVIA